MQKDAGMRSHQQIFAERLARIAAQAGNTNATLHIGMEAQVPQGMLMRLGNPTVARAVRAAAAGLSPWAVPAALFSGALALFAVHLGRVWLLGPHMAQLGLLFDLTGALFAILELRLAFRLRGPGALALQLTGAAIVAGGLHNAVHQWPALFSGLFPPEWTEAVLSTTEPMTVSLGMLAL